MKKSRFSDRYFIGVPILGLALAVSSCGNANNDETIAGIESDGAYASLELEHSDSLYPSSSDEVLEINLPSLEIDIRTGETYSQYDERSSAYAGRAGSFRGYGCTVDCSGHKAGYEWAEANLIDDPGDCSGNSISFEEGCVAYLEENETYAIPSAGVRRAYPDLRRPSPGLTSSRIGNTTIFSDGTTASRIGDTTVFSDGTSASRIGDTTIFSDGTSASRIGNTTIFSDGTSASRIGDTTIFSDGTSCSSIGSSTICN